MASFQATTSWESPRNCENKIIVPIISFPIRYKKFQKIAKKFKKLKNRIMASFQAQTGLKTPRKSENKNYRFDLFLHDPL